MYTSKSPVANAIIENTIPSTSATIERTIPAVAIPLFSFCLCFEIMPKMILKTAVIILPQQTNVTIPKINEAIAKETVNRKGENDTDKLLRTLMKKIPGPLIKFVVNTLMWMDKHNIMPKAIVELSPFHTSFFVTNLKSLGINHIYHHTYNFGTTGLFCAMGKEKQVPVVKGNEITTQKEMGFGLVSDERFCDGLYFALSLRKLRRFMLNPAVLEKPLDKKVEDVE